MGETRLNLHVYSGYSLNDSVHFTCVGEKHTLLGMTAGTRRGGRGQMSGASLAIANFMCFFVIDNLRPNSDAGASLGEGLDDLEGSDSKLSCS